MTVLAEVSNGRHQGRAAPAEKLEPFTFESTGRAVLIRKLPTFWRDTVRRQVKALPGFEEPQPPMVEQDYGDGKVTVPHKGHPLYQELLKEWGRRVDHEVGERITPFVIRRGVVCDGEGEYAIDEDAVKERRQWAADEGLNLDGFDDHYVYVAFCCIGPYTDWLDLLKAVFEKTAPTEAAIEAHKATFSSDV
jgi:hypothetical protein